MFGKQESDKAKDNQNTEETVLQDSEAKQPEQVQPVDEPVKEAKEAEKAPEQTMSVDTGALVEVELKTSLNFRCGGKWYDLKEGKTRVPKNVKDVLIARGVLKAI